VAFPILGATMKSKLPVPVCMAFLTCRVITNDANTQEDLLIGLPRCFWTRNFPGAYPLNFFIRCTSAHGEYSLEVQLQDSEGKVVWHDGPSTPWVMMDPLEMYDFRLKANVVFPAPGVYQFVLVLNGEEVTRQRFHAKLQEVPAQT
jgi:hypothetical protein